MMNLFTFKYWFNINPVAFIAPVRISLFVFLALLLLGALFFFFFRKKFALKKRLFQNLYNFCFLNLVLGSLLVFFEIQRISFFSARFWYAFWFIFMAWSLIIIIKKHKQYLINKEGLKKDKEFKKYLP